MCMMSAVEECECHTIPLSVDCSHVAHTPQILPQLLPALCGIHTHLVDMQRQSKEGGREVGGRREGG